MKRTIIAMALMAATGAQAQDTVLWTTKEDRYVLVGSVRPAKSRADVVSGKVNHYIRHGYTNGMGRVDASIVQATGCGMGGGELQFFVASTDADGKEEYVSDGMFYWVKDGKEFEDVIARTICNSKH
jgi:hypothetical protein